MKLKTAMMLSACAVACLCAASVFGGKKPLTIVSAGDAFMVQRFPANYSVAPEMKFTRRASPDAIHDFISGATE